MSSAPPDQPDATGVARRPFRFRIITRRGCYRLVVLFLLMALGLVVVGRIMLGMPGRGYHGALPALTPSQRELSAELRRDTEQLAAGIGYRSIFHARKLAQAAAYLHDQLTAAGYGTIGEYASERCPTPTLEVTLSGTTRPAEIVVIGAHYDSCQTTPGADDNATGVAATLALARRFAAHPQARTIRFVLFAGEEPPLFETEDMGSRVYAKACRGRGDRVVAMLSLEMLGCYSSAPESQHYPPPFAFLYPSTGNFVAFVSNVPNRGLVRRCIGSFRGHAQFPSEGAALPSGIPGIGWSDHWSFWQEGYPAIMVTDTAMFRNANYHQPADTPEKLDFDSMARVVEGLERVVEDLASR